MYLRCPECHRTNNPKKQEIMNAVCTGCGCNLYTYYFANKTDAESTKFVWEETQRIKNLEKERARQERREHGYELNQNQTRRLRLGGRAWGWIMFIIWMGLLAYDYRIHDGKYHEAVFAFIESVSEKLPTLPTFLTGEKPTCESMRQTAKGSTLKNAMGMKSKIVKIYELNEQQSTENLLVCTGSARYESGTVSDVTLTWEKDEDGDVFMRIEGSLF